MTPRGTDWSLALLVAATLLSGLVWAAGGTPSAAGYNLLNWHVALGALLGVAVLVHAVLRARPLRVRDVRSRRQFLSAAAVGAGAFAAWQVQRPLERALGLRGAERRFTNSYDAGARPRARRRRGAGGRVTCA